MALDDLAMDTPTAPLPDPVPKRKRRFGRKRRSDDDAAPKAPKTEGVVPAFKAGLSYVASAWRVLLAVLVVHFLLAMTVVVPLQARMAERLDGHAHGPSLSGTPDAYDARFEDAGWNDAGLAQGVFMDAKRLEKPLLDTQRLSLYWIVLVAWLFGAVVAGGHVGTVVGGASPTVAGFFQQGARYFWRMLRVGLVFGVVYYIAGRLVLEMWAKWAEVGETWSSTAASGFLGDLARSGVMVIVFLWMRVACDLARADLVVYERTSALAAVLRGLGRTLRHPIRTFGLALACGVPAVLIISGLALILGLLPLDSWIGILLGFAVIQLAVLMRLASRATVLAGDVQLLTADVRAGRRA